MSDVNTIDEIDVEQYHEVKEIIEKCYVKNKHIHLELKKPSKDTIIVTIKHNYTAFRKEIERLLKEKSVEDKDAKNILLVIDNNHKIIYKDNYLQNIKQQDTDFMDKDSESDPSDPSDPQEIKNITVSECIRQNSGTVKVIGSIMSVSEPYKVIIQDF